MGNCDEVPKQQKKMMKELGLKCRGEGNWPFFISYQSRFQPYPFSKEETVVFIKILKRLIDIMQNYLQHQIDIIFDDDEIIYAYQVNEQWIYEARVRPDPIERFPIVHLANEDYVNGLKNYSHTEHRLIMDLAYIPSSYQEKDYERPVHSLLFMLIDEKSEMILHCDIIKIHADEIQYCLMVLCTFIEQNGIPKSVCIRNPLIYSAFAVLCDDLGIELHVEHLDLVDEYLDEMMNHM